MFGPFGLLKLISEALRVSGPPSAGGQTLSRKYLLSLQSLGGQRECRAYELLAFGHTYESRTRDEVLQPGGSACEAA
jgi:hypothetical protein